MAKAMRETAKYCLSFTAAGLKPELASVMARIHAETGNWMRMVTQKIMNKSDIMTAARSL